MRALALLGVTILGLTVACSASGMLHPLWVAVALSTLGWPVDVASSLVGCLSAALGGLVSGAALRTRAGLVAYVIGILAIMMAPFVFVPGLAVDLARGVRRTLGVWSLFGNLALVLLVTLAGALGGWLAGGWIRPSGRSQGRGLGPDGQTDHAS